MTTWRRDYRLVLAARAVSAFGSGFGPVALAFGVLDLPSAGPKTLSLVLTCQAVPQLVFVLLGGVLADRLPRGRVLAAAEGAAGLAWGSLALMIGTGAAPVPALAAGAALAGLAAAPVGPAMTGMVATLVPGPRLRAANSSLRATTHTARIVGLALAGPTVGWLGAGWALAADATTYLLAATTLAAVRPAAGSSAARRLGRDLAEGWREFSTRQWLWVLVSAYSFAYAVTAAVAGVLGPLAALDHLGGPSAWSTVLAAQSVGTLTGALTARRVRSARPGRTAALLVPAAALPAALLAAHAPLALVAAGAAVAGTTTGILSVLAATTLQQQVPPAALSRVSAYDWFGSLASTPLALALAGPAAAVVGVPAALTACAVVVVAAGAATLLAPQVRNLRAADGTDSTPTAAAGRP